MNKKQSFHRKDSKKVPPVLNRINLEIKPLASDLLRTFPGCEHFSDEQAEQIIYSLRAYASILIQHLNIKKDDNP
jgi:hypothetical protein